MVAAFAALLLSSSPALAAAPESPQLEVTGHGAETASLRGVLSPGGPGQEGTYEFVYAATPAGCVEGSSGRRGLSSGVQGEEVFEELSGLLPDTQYSVCLRDRNLQGEESLSPPVSFTTSFLPEAPETGAADAITSSTATLHGALNPSSSREAEPGVYEFLYKRSASECEGESATPQIAAATGQEREAVQAEASGLAPATQYTFCLRTWNTTGQSATGAPVTFKTLAQKPTVAETTVSNVGTAGATVSARIETGNVETSYSVQYGATTAYGSETTPIGLTGGTQTVSATLTDLQPNSVYHFRFRAANQEGSETGADGTFVTYPADHALPDGRVYEMVTPPNNNNAEVYELNEGLLQTPHPFQASIDGNRIAYTALPTTEGNGSSGASLGNDYVAVRSPQGGWTQRNITPAGSSAEASYQAYSGDLTMGVLSTFVGPPFSTTASLAEPVGGFGPDANLVPYFHAFDEATYRPLFTAAPQHRVSALRALETVPGPAVLFWVFGATVATEITGHAPRYAGGSTDMSHMLFEANDDLLEGQGPLEQELNAMVTTEVVHLEEANMLERENRRAEARALRAANDNTELYMSVDGHPSLVNVLPSGNIATGATFGAPGPLAGIFEYADGPEFSHDISTDGAKVFWSAGPVYVRVDGVSTVQVSTGPATFWTASPDGRYAFYVEAGQLWRFDVQTDTRVQLAGSAGGVVGVIGTNETGADGSYVYFVSTEAIVGTENVAKQQPVEGEHNLYVYEPDTERAGQSRIAFLGTLTPEDASDWAPGLGERSTSLTPDGHALVFTAHNNLTGVPYPAEGSEEVYVYSATDGSVHCASCVAQASGGHLQTPANLTLSTRTGASLVHGYRRVSEDGGRVYFDSTAPLVARDVNGMQDVYEWERDGTGDCAAQSGCVYLLSGGGHEGPAFLVDAGANGDDVFLATRQRLTPEDGNENVDIYDARVGGVRPVVPPACTGTGCQGVPGSSPAFATPSSVTFNGVGNFATKTAPSSEPRPRRLTRKQKLARALAACHRIHRKRRRVACYRRARRLYGASPKKPNMRRAK